MEFPGKLKLNTITDPGVSFDVAFFSKYIEGFNNLMIKGRESLKDPLSYFIKKSRPFPIFKSSPFTSSVAYSPFKPKTKEGGVNLTGMFSTHVVALLEAMHCIRISPLFPILKEFAELFDKRTLNVFRCMVFADPKHSDPDSWKELGFSSNPWENKPLGKLSLKKEAAGKVRVFAMVDPITQWILRPLHKYLFSILKGVKMDGTFNQLRPVYRLFRLSGIRSFFSLDLSAATDRLPASLQAALLEDLVGKSIPQFGWKWLTLLVNRDYKLRSEEFHIDGIYRYKVGQPMGALSSWAMLAYCHHFIVQVAAWEVGFDRSRLFTHYAVLGDDLVIANWKVAKSYLRILKILGVECGLAKSVLSHKGRGLEFAKSTFVDSQNVSPISLKELETAMGDLSAWSAFASKFGLTWDRQSRVLGFGYLARRKSFAKLNHALQLVYLSQIVKADINTDVLRLRKGAPKSFNSEYLKIFNIQVLEPLYNILKGKEAAMGRFERSTQSLISDSWNRKFQSDYWDTRTLWDAVYYSDSRAIFQRSSWKSDLDKLRKFVLDVKDMERWEKAIARFGRVYHYATYVAPTFDQALSFYLKGQDMLARVSEDIYRLDLPKKRDKRLGGKLPYQVRIFRKWSRLTHKVIEDFRNMSKS